jgi:zinc transport system substrate-binding protein
MLRRTILKATILAAVMGAAFPALAQFEPITPQNGDRLKIGITLHPYYSFVANIVGDAAEVVPLIDEGSNPHGYQPQAADIARAGELDALVVNGVGHDEWAFEIIAAAGRSENLPIIEANASVALIPVATDPNVVNPHTFISTTAAVQQVFEIARRLSELDPVNSDIYLINAQAYAGEIRQLRAGFMEGFAALETSNFHAASVHAGYDYLFQEFGLQIEAVIEPRHGVNPTAAQLAETIELIEAANVNTLFTEQYFEGELAETISRATGVRVYPISHINGGPYTPEKFIEEMRSNIGVVLRAVEESNAP